MQRHTWLVALVLSPALLSLAGCGGNPPTVETGSFEGEKEFNIDRGLIDVVVETDGEASYVARQWPYTHPMGQPGDTEVVVTRPKDEVRIENHQLPMQKFRINGEEYEYQPPEQGRMKVRVDRGGKVTMLTRPREEKK